VATVLPWPARERLDRCAAVFHQSFALADVMVAAAALLSTFATVRAAPGSLRLVLFTSGALGFLASMNALFYLEQRQWQAIGSLPVATTIVATYAASIWIAWTAWRLRHLFLSPSPSPSR